MRKHHLLVPILAMAAALALTACGGGKSDEDKITGAVEAMFKSTDPEDCSTLATPAFLEQSAKKPGKAAIEKCEEQVEGTGSGDAVIVKKVEVDGSTATADATFLTGHLEGQTLTIGLVEEDGDWKLNQFESFAEFNRAKMIEEFDKSLSENDSLSATQADCIVAGLEGASDAEVEGLILRSSLNYLTPLIQGCG